MILWGRLPHLRVSNGAYLVQKSASPEAGATLFWGGCASPRGGRPGVGKGPGMGPWLAFVLLAVPRHLDPPRNWVHFPSGIVCRQVPFYSQA